jgi:hypothetical protein
MANEEQNLGGMLGRRLRLTGLRDFDRLADGVVGSPPWGATARAKSLPFTPIRP